MFAVPCVIKTKQRMLAFPKAIAEGELLFLYWLEIGTTIGSRDLKWLHVSSLEDGGDFTIMLHEHENIEAYFEALT
jgi:hypothetical protein